MLHVAKRAVNILKRDGISSFVAKGARYASSYARWKFFPWADRKNANWHSYLRELDARAELLTCTPWKLGFESTSLCNLQCVMCAHVFMQPRQGRHFDAAALEQFREYIAAAGEFQLMGCGEPLISPSFWKIMEYIKQFHKIPPRIAISSNAAAMTRNFAEKLLDSPLEEISFSLDAAGPETYRKIRGADFFKTVGNIRYLLRRRSERGQKHPLVMLNMTIMRENIAEIVPFAALASDLGVDAVSFWPLHDYDLARTGEWEVSRNGWTFSYRQQMPGRDAEDAAYANAQINKAVQAAKERDMRIILPVGGLAHIEAPRQVKNSSAAENAIPSATMAASLQREVHDQPALKECVAPWEWMTVNTSGDVHACCYMEETCGNIRDNNPEDIWNGPVYREMRRCLARNILPAACKNAACKYVRSAWIYSGSGVKST
jgi:MoaA/NifB/PqqE/SkfB family radical SAM enzyme